MKGLIDRLRRMQLSWIFLAICVLIMLIICVLMINGTQKQLQLTRSQLSERQLELFNSQAERDALQLKVDSIGSDRYIENTALKQGMQVTGSVRFTIINYESLDKYTEEEWKSVMEDLEWEGRLVPRFPVSKSQEVMDEGGSHRDRIEFCAYARGGDRGKCRSAPDAGPVFHTSFCRA